MFYIFVFLVFLQNIKYVEYLKSYIEFPYEIHKILLYYANAIKNKKNKKHSITAYLFFLKTHRISKTTQSYIDFPPQIH